MLNTNSGIANGLSSGESEIKNSEKTENLPKIPLELVDLKSFRLASTENNARHASHEVFDTFARGIVEVKSPLKKWTVERRRDFLNWCLTNGVLRIEGDRLIPTKEPDKQGDVV